MNDAIKLIKLKIKDIEKDKEYFIKLDDERYEDIKRYKIQINILEELIRDIEKYDAYKKGK